MAVGERTKFGQILAEWQVPEYIKYERSKVWYIVAGSLTVALFIYSVVTLNILFSIIILITVAIVYLHDRRHPEMLDFMILETGIMFGDTYYSYKNLNSFWVVYEPPHVEVVYLGINSAWRKELPIHLEGQNPVIVRRILLNYLEEDLDKEEEAMEEGLGRLFKL